MGQIGCSLVPVAEFNCEIVRYTKKSVVNNPPTEIIPKYLP